MTSRASARRRTMTAAAVASAVAITGLAATQANAAARPGTMELASKPAAGGVPAGESRAPAVTPDGRYVVFQSIAANLTSPADQLRHWDVYLRDTKTGATKKVSTGTGGAEASGDSLTPTVTPDGRYVVFLSSAGNLVAGDEPHLSTEPFIKDMKTGKITALIKGQPGPEEYGSARNVSVSADGKVVVFASDRADLVKGDTNGASDVFVWRRTTGKLTRISVTSSGRQAGAVSSYAPFTDSKEPQITADGRLVVFSSGAGNLVKGDTNGITDVFTHDLRTHRTRRISVGPQGQQGTGGLAELRKGAAEPTISADGRTIAYTGFALKGIVEKDDNTTRQVYVYTRRTRQTQVVAPAGPAGYSYSPSISPDGRFLAFVTDRSDLAPGEQERDDDVFVKDLKTNRIARASVGQEGQEPNGAAGLWGIDAGAGGKVAFSTRSSNLTADQVNGTDYEVFVRSFGKGFWK